MRSIFLAALLVVSIGYGTPAVVAQPQQPVGPQPTATPTDTERIDANTVIVESEYRANESVALVTLRSEIQQVVSISDAGRFQAGGTIPVRTVALRAGGESTIEIPVTERDGYVGLAISTKNTPLYAEIIEQSSGGLDILRAMSSLQAWLAGATVAFVWMIIAGWNTIRSEDRRPEVA